MSIFFTSDNHFWHQNIIKYCNRPFKTVEEMNEVMIARWNEVVGIDDTVYHLGDFSMSFRSVELYTRRLNGSKHLILGNHDFAHPAHKKGKKDPEGWKQKYLDQGWDSVRLEDKVLVGGELMLLHHMPYKGDHTQGERYLEYRPLDTGLTLLHGHIHQHWLKKGNQINVGVDRNNFTPVSEARIIELRETKGDL